MQDVRQYLREKGITYKEVRRPDSVQAVYPCPNCGDPKKFGVNLESGHFKCFRENNCGFNGTWFDLQKYYGDDYKPLVKKDRLVQVKPKKEYKKIETKTNELTPEASNFLKGRGFSDNTIKHFRIKSSKDGKSIMIPSFENKQLVNIKYRSIKEKKFWNEKDAKPVLYNMDNCTDYDALIITEGHFDTMAAKEYELNTVSIPSGVSDLTWIELCWDYIEKFSRVILTFDMDQAGQDAVEKVVKRIGEWKCYKAELPYKDLNECLLKKVEKNIIHDAIFKAKEFDHHLIERLEDYKDSLPKAQENRVGTKIKYDKINECLRGWRTRESSVWVGKNASGKTTFIGEILLDILSNDKKCCILSLEMPYQKLLNWYIMQYSNKSFLQQENYDEFIDRYNDYLYLIKAYGSIKEDHLIDVMTYAYRKHEVEHFFIDNTSGLILKKNHSQNEAEKSFILRVNDFCQEYESHVHLIAHPRKSSHDNDRPGKVDVMGSGHWTNLAHNVFVVYRPTIEERNKKDDLPDMMFYVRKNREWGKEERIDFDFWEDTKRFTERKDDIFFDDMKKF